MKNLLQKIAGGIIILAAVVGTGAYAFTQPTGTPPANNVPAPINTGATAQSKAGNFAAAALAGTNVLGANKVISQNQFCFRNGQEDDCITEWPGGGSGGQDFSTTCTIDTMLIHGQDETRQQWGVPHGPVGYTGSAALGSRCMSRLSAAEQAEGWMVVSFDNCPGVQGKDCAGVSYCQFIKLECGNGITFQQGDFTRRSYLSGGSSSGGGSDIPGPGTTDPSPGLLQN